MTAPFIVIGNPENRRVELFQRELAQMGRAPATVVSWLELIARPDRLLELPERPALLRIDSAGESFAVERGLLRLGYEAAAGAGVWCIEPTAIARLTPDRGRILCPRQAHLGFEHLLDRLDALLSHRPQWRVLNHPTSIIELFDKRRTSRRYRAAGIPVPDPLDGVDSPATLRRAMGERGWSTVFVKLSCSSSASCLALYRLTRGSEFLITTMRDEGGTWYNSLRLQRLNRRARIDRVLRLLLREGSQIERAIPKARLDRAPFDCRVLVVDGEPTFIVVRQNHHPITNLHLGGWRGDPQALKKRAPEKLYQLALHSCRWVAGLHQSFQLGVDLLFEAGWRGHRVIEANAFGDLLPNLTRRGLSVYGWQIARATGRPQ